MKSGPFIFKKPLVIGHRGFSAEYPENTMVSFEAAVRAGAGMFELDITLSRDSEVVVIHDDTLDRTTSGSGPVVRYTLPELRKLDAGGWFHKKFTAEKIPTLNEVLDAFVDRILINIEIKPDITSDPSYNGMIVRKTLAAVAARGANHRVLISSFDPEILMTAAGSSRPPAIALLLEEAIGEDALTVAETLGALSIHPDMAMLDAGTVQRAQTRGVLVIPYNVATEKEICQAIEMGVDGLFVDDPVMAMRCCQNRPASFP